MAGRNLAGPVEAAARNFVLQQRGIDTMQEFMTRQDQQMLDDAATLPHQRPVRLSKSVALKALEDAGFYCVDNLPARCCRS